MGTISFSKRIEILAPTGKPYFEVFKCCPEKLLGMFDSTKFQSSFKAQNFVLFSPSPFIHLLLPPSSYPWPPMTHLLLEVASPLSLPFSIPLPFIFQEAKESIDEEDPRPTSSNGACIMWYQEHLHLGDSNNNYLRRLQEKPIPYIISILAQIAVKLLTCIYVAFAALGKCFVVRSVDNQPRSHEKTKSAQSNSEEQLMTLAIKEPLWQRIQNLEAVVTEMANKPNTIPPEKEDILQESLSRIKCIEYDLQKTKKALLATASKQVELAESLESLKESKFDGRNSCWPKNRSYAPGR
ncbi:Phosphatidylinositol/phosphatidylcholine transfer protein SFH9 [Glycine soja]